MSQINAKIKRCRLKTGQHGWIKDGRMDYNLPEPLLVINATGVNVLYWLKVPCNYRLNMNFRRNTDDGDLTDSGSDNEYSKKSKVASGESLYEEVSDSDIDEKEHIDGMRDVGVDDVT